MEVLNGAAGSTYVRDPNSTVDRRLSSFRSTTQSHRRASRLPVPPSNICAGRSFAIFLLFSHSISLSQLPCSIGNSGAGGALAQHDEQCSSGNVDLYGCRTRFLLLLFNPFIIQTSYNICSQFFYLSKVLLLIFYFMIFFINFDLPCTFFITFCFPFFLPNFFPTHFHILNYFRNIFFLKIFQILTHLFYDLFFKKFSFKFLSQIFVSKRFFLRYFYVLFFQKIIFVFNLFLKFFPPTIFYSSFCRSKYILEIFVS